MRGYDGGEHIASCADGTFVFNNWADTFTRMLASAHQRMDQLGYPPINHPIFNNPTKENQT